jgi:hypothetical protein
VNSQGKVVPPSAAVTAYRVPSFTILITLAGVFAGFIVR